MSYLPALVFETSTPAASVALIRGYGSLEQLAFTSDRSHNALLFNPLAELMAKLDGKLPVLVLVGSGPGSYSGTRVGIAAAQGVAIAAGCPAVAVPSILAVPSAENGAACLAIGDARRGNFWTAAISGNSLETEPVLTQRDGLEQAIAAAIEKNTAVFSFEDPSKLPLPAEMIAKIHLEHPDATRLWNVWHATDAATRARWSAEIPQPMYLAPPHITPAKRSWLTTP